MKIDLARFRDTFLEEASEHVASIEVGLLELESDPTDEELLNSVFRAAHSIKGGSSAVGLTDVARFTHVLEGLLDRVRANQIAFTRELGNLLLESNDVLRQLIAAARTDGAAPGETEQVLARLAEALGEPGEDREESRVSAGEIVSGSPAPHASRTVSVRFVPASDLLLQGLDPVLLLRDVMALGTVRVIDPDLSRLPALAEIDPERCYLAWTVELDTDRPESDLRDVFAFAEDSCEIEVTEGAAVDAVPSRAASAGGVARTTEAPPPPPPGERPEDATAIASRDARGSRGSPPESSSIRVATDKVDRLINLVGELVITQSMISEAVRDFSTDKLIRLQEAVAEMELNTRELQERVMAVRMMPIGSVFNRFPRLVRDLASSFGKSISLRMNGEDTELDKGVVERIGDPLTHLVRNAVDHGIESPEARRAAGKPPEGTISLRAFHLGGSVVVEVSDDGRGLDTARIREKAVALGLLAADGAVSDEQVCGFIFEPGFSTAERVTDVSGRGVGMDVVKRNIEELNGSVSVHTEPGRGTRFRIRLPLTLAILDGLLMSVGEEVYILPLTTIVESLRPQREVLRTVLGRGEVVALRGEFVPLLRLHVLFATATRITDPSEGLVVIVENEGHRLGLLVDEILGQSQVVIKNLEQNFRRIEGVMGATIMGDGRVALILDVPGLARLQTSNDNGLPTGGQAHPATDVELAACPAPDEQEGVNA
jgi:two-component system, chemotaxis family, sensor kinase CheA